MSASSGASAGTAIQAFCLLISRRVRSNSACSLRRRASEYVEAHQGLAAVEGG
jgi:hypothetical protein